MVSVLIRGGLNMQRIVAELYDRVLEGVVVDGTLIDEGFGTFDLASEFTVQSEDGALSKVLGWAADVKV